MQFPVKKNALGLAVLALSHARRDVRQLVQCRCRRVTILPPTQYENYYRIPYSKCPRGLNR